MKEEDIWCGKALPQSPAERDKCIKKGGFGVVTLLSKELSPSCIKYQSIPNDSLTDSQLCETTLRVDHQYLVSQCGHKIIPLCKLNTTIVDKLNELLTENQNKDPRNKKEPYNSVLALGFKRCEGPDLASTLQQQKSSDVFNDFYMLHSFFFIQEIKLIAVEMLLAITQLHLKCIFHNDIKPANILFDGEEFTTDPKLKLHLYKLSDLGASLFNKGQVPITIEQPTKYVSSYPPFPYPI